MVIIIVIYLIVIHVIVINVKDYIEINNKLPSKQDTIKDIKQLPEWLSTQQKNYKNKKDIMKDEIIINKYEKFKNDSKYQEYFL